MAEPSPIPVFCDSCGNAFKVRPKAAGRRVSCPACKQPTVVPKTTEPQPTPSTASADHTFDDPLNSPSLDHSPPTPPIPAATRPSRRKPEPSATEPTHRFMRTLALCFRVFAVLVLLPWFAITTIGGFGLLGMASQSNDPPELPAGVTLLDDPSDFELDLTHEQRAELAEYQTAESFSGAASGAMVLSFFPWLAMTLATAFLAILNAAAAEFLLLMIRIERNTEAAASQSAGRDSS